MKYLNYISSWFLGDYIASTEDYLEQIKVGLAFRVSVFKGIMLLMMVPSVLVFGNIVIFLNVCAVLATFAAPFIIKYKRDYRFATKIALSATFLCAAAIHIALNVPNLLGIGVWYIVIVMIASFVLDKNWALGYAIISIINISLVVFFKQFEINLFNVPQVFDFVGQQDAVILTPLRFAIPLFIIYNVIIEYIKNKDKIENKILTVLNKESRLNQELEKSRSRYKNLVDGVDDLIYQIDGKGNLIFTNPAMCRKSGFNNQEILDMNFLDPVPKEYHKDHLAFYTNQIQNQISTTYREFPFICKDGGLIWLGQRVNMTFDEKGNLQDSMCIARDITEDRQIKQELVEAKEKAIAASRVKAQFLSSMSHEIRTPMNAVIALIHILMQENPREDQQDHLSTLKFSAENLLGLINDILDFSKIEAGKIEFRQIRFNLHQVTQTIHHGLGSQAQEKEVDLVLNLAPNVPRFIKGDALRLTQVLNNLVGNAVKFTDEGKVVLSISVKEEMDQQVLLHFEVKDTGIGIPEEKLDSIFEDFSQVSDETIRQGTGLGLAITKELLALQGSSIQVSSILGQGSTFEFSLKFDRCTACDTAVETEVIEKELPANLTDSLLGIKLLLVEDNLINQKVTMNFLRKWGLEVDIADNGQIAVDLVKEKDYHVVLMDLQMPVMNGVEATKVIRSMKGKYLQLPIIALTASAVLEVKDEAIEAGLDDFVTKPFVPEKLYQKINQYIPQKNVATNSY